MPTGKHLAKILSAVHATANDTDAWGLLTTLNDWRGGREAAEEGKEMTLRKTIEAASESEVEDIISAIYDRHGRRWLTIPAPKARR